jgi:hypothetical protein
MPLLPLDELVQSESRQKLGHKMQAKLGEYAAAKAFADHFTALVPRERARLLARCGHGESPSLWQTHSTGSGLMLPPTVLLLLDA